MFGKWIMWHTVLYYSFWNDQNKTIRCNAILMELFVATKDTHTFPGKFGDWMCPRTVLSRSAIVLLITYYDSQKSFWCHTNFGLSRGDHRAGSLTCSREMVITWHFLFGMFLCLSVVTMIIPKKLSVLPCILRLVVINILIMWLNVNNYFVCMLTWFVTRQRSILLLVKNKI